MDLVNVTNLYTSEVNSMAEYNITILQKNESGTLDTYYPKTIAAQVTESTEKQFLSAAKKTQYDENTLYTNDTPIVAPTGQIVPGDTFNEEPVKNMLTKILYPYVQPEIEGNTSVSSRVVEKGVTTTISSVTANVTKKSNPIDTVELYNGATVVEIKSDAVSDGGTFVFNQVINVTDSTVLKVKTTDTKPTTVEAVVAEYTYVYPFYHGTVAQGVTIDAAAVLALVKDVSVKDAKTYTYDLDDTCAVIAYPAAYGDLVKVEDVNGFDNLPSFTKSTVAVTGTDGTNQNYNVYVKEPGTATGFKLTYLFE
jgi:hypothetical protein